MHDYYIARQTESRLGELRAEATRDRLARPGHPRARIFTAVVAAIAAMRTTPTPDVIACCA